MLGHPESPGYRSVTIPVDWAISRQPRAPRESPQRPYAAHPNVTVEGEEMVQTATFTVNGW
jgi:hypothetical protein